MDVLDVNCWQKCYAHLSNSTIVCLRCTNIYFVLPSVLRDDRGCVPRTLGFISQRRDQLRIVTDTQRITLILRFIVDRVHNVYDILHFANCGLHYTERNQRPLRLSDRQIAINIVNNTNHHEESHIIWDQTFSFLVITWSDVCIYACVCVWKI